LLDFYSVCTRHLVRRISKDGKKDVLIGLALAVCTGIVAFLLHDHDWLRTSIIAICGLLLYFWFIVTKLFAKAPAQIFVSAGIRENAMAETWKSHLVAIVVVAFIVLFPSGMGYLWCSGHSFERESKDSLRHRTTEISKAVQHYLEERTQQHPAYAYPDSRDPNPTIEQQQKIEACQKYDGDTFQTYRDNYMDTMVNIVKEYKAKGVDTGTLESDLTQHIPWAGTLYGASIADVECMNDLCKFKELRYHITVRDTRVDIP